MPKQTREKPYFCEVFASVFSQRVHLKSHMETSTGEKPHSYVVCASAFSYVIFEAPLFGVNRSILMDEFIDFTEKLKKIPINLYLV